MDMKRMLLPLSLAAALAGLADGPFAPDERIVCLGDSITHGGHYYGYLQLMQCLRHPGSGVRFLNCGISGDTTAGAIKRWDWDVLAKRPSRVFMMFGMNDVGSSNWRDFSPDAQTLAARAAALGRYGTNLVELARLARAAGTPLTVVTPSPYDQYGDVAAVNNAACNDPGLASCAEAGRELARAQNLPIVDLHAGLTPIWRAHPERRLSGTDRVHPGKVGHLLMASRFWEAFGETNAIASVRVAARNDAATYRHEPAALPFPLVDEWREADEIVPLSDRFNRETFAVTGLSEGLYTLAADGEPLGTFSSGDLAAGVNLALLETPGQKRARLAYARMGDARATAARLRGLVAMEIRARARGADVTDYAATTNALLAWVEELAARKNKYLAYYSGQVKAYVQGKPDEEGMRRRLEEAYAAMEALAKPVAYTLTVTRARNVIHVDSETGDDRADGSPGHPLRTISAARDAVRRIRREGRFPKRGFIVEVSGRFAWTDDAPCFELTDEDSGESAEAPVVYRASRRGATIEGALRVALASFVPYKGDILCADLGSRGIRPLPALPRQFHDWPGTELFADGCALRLARWPNEGWALTDKILDRGVGELDPKMGERRYGVRGGTFTYTEDDPGRWNVADGIYMLGYWGRDWASETLRVAKIDPVARAVTTEGVHRYGMGTSVDFESYNRRYFAYNFLDALDAPGEWYLDHRTMRLYLIPPAELRDAVSIALRKAPLVSLKNVRHVRIEGFSLGRTRGPAVLAEGAEGVVLRGLSVRDCSQNGLVFTGGENCTIADCRVGGIGSTGIWIDAGDRRSLTPCNHRVTDTEVHHCGRLSRIRGHGIDVHGCGVRIDHCYVHDMPYIAVKYYGNDHLIEFNEIECAMMESADGGGIYTGRDWGSQGSVVRYNYLHDFGQAGVRLRASQGIAPEYEPLKDHVVVMGVYLDDCDSGDTVAHNLFVRTGRALFVGGGRDNKMRGNLVVDSKSAAHCDIRGVRRAKPGSGVADGWDLLAKLRDLGWQEGVWAKRYPWLVDVMENRPLYPVGTEFTDNVAVNCTDCFNVEPEMCDTVVNTVVLRGNVSFGERGAAVDRALFSEPWQPGYGKIDFRRQAEVERASADPRTLQDTAAFREACPGFIRIPLEEVGPSWRRGR